MYFSVVLPLERYLTPLYTPKLAAPIAVMLAIIVPVDTAANRNNPPEVPPSPAIAPVVANATTPSSAVVVNTGQGPLIRDARLEELLAEHRQNGSMSALQMPTGFIRNATYDAAGR